jgi:hypothetical protein
VAGAAGRRQTPVSSYGAGGAPAVRGKGSSREAEHGVPTRGERMVSRVPNRWRSRPLSSVMAAAKSDFGELLEQPGGGDIRVSRGERHVGLWGIYRYKNLAKGSRNLGESERFLGNFSSSERTRVRSVY